MGRSPFFNGSRKMRGFPLNLNHGPLGGEDMPPGTFPYFPNDKFEFGYAGAVGFHHEFFGPPPPPHPHGPPFPGPGNPGGEFIYSTNTTISLHPPIASPLFSFIPALNIFSTYSNTEENLKFHAQQKKNIQHKIRARK